MPVGGYFLEDASSFIIIAEEDSTNVHNDKVDSDFNNLSDKRAFLLQDFGACAKCCADVTFFVVLLRTMHLQLVHFLHRANFGDFLLLKLLTLSIFECETFNNSRESDNDFLFFSFLSGKNSLESVHVGLNNNNIEIN